MPSLDSVLSRLDRGLDESLERLFTLLRIQSISTDPQYVGECRKAAELCAADLRSIGFDAHVRDTAGHPMVVGHHRQAGPAQPHVMFYGHYDVQPVDPIGLWTLPPFEPHVNRTPEGSATIVGRGASDDKGQLMTFVEACRAWIAETGGLPINVTILLEGEEESGSPSLEAFLSANRAELTCDVAFVCDANMWNRTTPGIPATLRGLVGDEIVIRAANRDLHSGQFGSAARNPNHVLARILADLHTADGAVGIPGFYEGVSEIPPHLATEWAKLGLTTDDLLGPIGLRLPAGEDGRSALEMIWARPTCEINGMIGGYTQPGFKTVIPASASAKVSFRLVGKQDPLKVRAMFRAFVSARIPDDCSVEFHPHGGSPALAIPFDKPLAVKSRAALAAEWGAATVITAAGGSVPIIGEFKRILGMDSLPIGFALRDDRIHSPNEKYELTSFHKGQRSWARIMHAVAV